MMSEYMPWLATLDQLRMHQSLTESAAEKKDDDLLRRLLRQASQDFMDKTYRTFVPFYDIRQQRSNSPTVLPFDEDLLEVKALTYNEVAVDIADYDLYPFNKYPKRWLASRSVACRPLPCGRAYRNPIMLDGIWGCVRHYNHCWKPLVALEADLAATAAFITFPSDVLPYAQIGTYLRTAVDDDGVYEMMQITDVVEDKVYLSRSEQGSTAVNRTASVPTPLQLYRFEQNQAISGAVIEIAIYRYKNKDQIGSRVSVWQNGAVQVEDMDPTVKETIEAYRRKAPRQF